MLLILCIRYFLDWVLLYFLHVSGKYVVFKIVNNHPHPSFDRHRYCNFELNFEHFGRCWRWAPSSLGYINPASARPKQLIANSKQAGLVDFMVCTLTSFDFAGDH